MAVNSCPGVVGAWVGRFFIADPAARAATITVYTDRPAFREALLIESDDRIDRFSRDLEFGEVMVNAVKYTPYLPHLGIKQSGIGRERGVAGLREYQEIKHVVVAPSPT